MSDSVVSVRTQCLLSALTTKQEKSRPSSRLHTCDNTIAQESVTRWFCSPALFCNRPRRSAKSITAAAAEWPLEVTRWGQSRVKARLSCRGPVFSAAHQHSHLSQQKRNHLKRSIKWSITTRVLVSVLRLLRTTRDKYWGWQISIFQIYSRTRRRLRLEFLCGHYIVCLCEHMINCFSWKNVFPSDKQTRGSHFSRKLDFASLLHHYVIDGQELKKKKGDGGSFIAQHKWKCQMW